MSTATVIGPAPTPSNTPPARNGSWITPLNLHWAAAGLLVLLNLYLIVHLFVLWNVSRNYKAESFEQQNTQLRVARVAAQPLRGLDEKLAAATAGADGFYKDRLPQTYSEVISEFGALTRKAGVRLTGAQYTPAIVLPNSTGQLTELDIDARLSGEYRPLVQLLNSLERDKTFFVIRTVTFNGQQSGAVNLRLRVTTYLRGGPPPPDSVASTSSASFNPVAEAPPGRSAP